MSQRDDASDDDEQNEETDASDAIDTDRSTESATGDADDEASTTEASEAAEESGPTAKDESAESTDETADSSSDTGEQPTIEADETETSEADEVEAPESDESTPTEDESVEGDVESEIGESGVTEEDAPSSAPAKGPDEVYCQSCGEPIKAEAEVCPHCGVRQPGSSSGEKNSAIAFIASLIIPGAGQAYNEQFGRAIAAFIGAIVADTILLIVGTLLSIILIGVFFFLLIPVVHVVIAYDAYNQAEKINRGEVTV